MKTTQASVDLAKSVFQVAISTTTGRVEEQHPPCYEKLDPATRRCAAPRRSHRSAHHGR